MMIQNELEGEIASRKMNALLESLSSRPAPICANVREDRDAPTTSITRRWFQLAARPETARRRARAHKVHRAALTVGSTTAVSSGSPTLEKRRALAEPAHDDERLGERPSPRPSSRAEDDEDGHSGHAHPQA